MYVHRVDLAISRSRDFRSRLALEVTVPMPTLKAPTTVGPYYIRNTFQVFLQLPMSLTDSTVPALFFTEIFPFYLTATLLITTVIDCFESLILKVDDPKAGTKLDTLPHWHTVMLC